MESTLFQLGSGGCGKRLLAAKAVTAVVLIGSIGGCRGEDWQAKTYPAHGLIKINGEAPEGAVVTLQPTGEEVDRRGSNPWAIVQGDGGFTLSTYERGDGAPLGEYAVTVRWPVDVTEMSAALTDRLGGAYSSKERSRWKVTIEEGDNELPLIEITGPHPRRERNHQSRRAPE